MEAISSTRSLKARQAGVKKDPLDMVQKHNHNHSTQSTSISHCPFADFFEYGRENLGSIKTEKFLII
jgi:hypothetical protein